MNQSKLVVLLLAVSVLWTDTQVEALKWCHKPTRKNAACITECMHTVNHCRQHCVIRTPWDSNCNYWCNRHYALCDQACPFEPTPDTLCDKVDRVINKLERLLPWWIKCCVCMSRVMFAFKLFFKSSWSINGIKSQKKMSATAPQRPKHTKFVLVFWAKKPFELLEDGKHIITDNIDEAFKCIRMETGCHVACIKKDIKRCLHRIMHKVSATSCFEDKWHGFYVRKFISDGKPIDVEEALQTCKATALASSYDPWFNPATGGSVLHVVQWKTFQWSFGKQQLRQSVTVGGIPYSSISALSRKQRIMIW